VQVVQAIAGYRGLQNTYALAETLYKVTGDFFFGCSQCEES
jgi:hypothetical protein